MYLNIRLSILVSKYLSSSVRGAGSAPRPPGPRPRSWLTPPSRRAPLPPRSRCLWARRSCRRGGRSPPPAAAGKRGQSGTRGSPPSQFEKLLSPNMCMIKNLHSLNNKVVPISPPTLTSAPKLYPGNLVPSSRTNTARLLASPCCTVLRHMVHPASVTEWRNIIESEILSGPASGDN